MDTKNSPRRVAAAERRTKALELRKAGLTFAQIGKALGGCSEQRAHKLVTDELRRLNAKRSEVAAEVLRLELERLDALLFSVWTKAKAGNSRAVAAALAIMARRAKLLGLDAPEKKELTGGGGGALRFTLEDAIEASKELEKWERERISDHGPGEVQSGSPEVP